MTFKRLIQIGWMLSILFAPFILRGDENLIDLQPFENRFWSQNGEDGVLLAIFSAIGETNRYYVEFGVENGAECNTHYLREILGWKGLMMDGGHANPTIGLQQEMITDVNINALFKKYNVPAQFDLLSIDIDSNDFYVWNAISPAYSPRVVVIEYNARHFPGEDKVIQYETNKTWDYTVYYGASITALERLGRKKGYTLVYAESKGVNLFFIRNDILEALPFKFKNAGNVSEIYRPATWGHLPDALNRPYVSSEEILSSHK